MSKIDFDTLLDEVLNEGCAKESDDLDMEG